MGQGIRVACAMGAMLAVTLELAALAAWQGWLPQPPRHAAQPPVPAAQPPAALPMPLPVAQPHPEDRHYAQLRQKVRWVPTRMAGGTWQTPDLPSRMLLAKSAAERAGLQEVGLGFEDVYGIIDAETSWVPRNGASRDGTPNLGVAQFEPATAHALGLRDPHDVVEAVHVAALHMKEAAAWSAGRIAGLKLRPGERAERLREGVSIYYNLSSRGRSLWNGRNTDRLPRETHAHIRNAKRGAQEAAFLDTQLSAVVQPGSGEPSVVAATESGRNAYVQ